MGHLQTAVSLRAYLEFLADDAGTAVPAADGAEFLQVLPTDFTYHLWVGQEAWSQ